MVDAALVEEPDAPSPDGAPLRVAMVAPPWIPVPPPGYGGIESVIADVSGGLVRRGHEVTLLAAPGSRSTADVVPLLDRAHAEEMGSTLYEADHVARALDVLDAAAERGQPYDIVHDHSGVVLFALANRIDVPVLHTVHGPVTGDVARFYHRHAHKAWLSSLSRSQLAGSDSLRTVGAIPNPLDVDRWPFESHKEAYLLWIGRMSPEKGPHRAIVVARIAGRPLVLAGPVQPGQQAFFDAEVAPYLDGIGVRYVEEVGLPDKQRLYARAAALLMPIRWAEPFGMVMIEAMACGTPVIAFREGAAPEVVLDERSGFLVDDEEQMARAVERLDAIDAVRCRAAVADRYGVDRVAQAYERAYRRVIAAAPARAV
jgi:glycosyltransferase involved in cell wall biosynthesis